MAPFLLSVATEESAGAWNERSDHRAVPSPPPPAGRPLPGLPGFFALPVENFATASGQHTNAVYGFTSMLVNVLRDEVPTHVAVAFDRSRQTFRLEQYSAEYKAKRNKTPTSSAASCP